MDSNPYKAYADERILNASPLGLVVALYEGAIESCVNARRCLAAQDIPGRTKALNKVVNILGELMRSLNEERGAEVSANLKRLYIYIQGRIIEAQSKKSATPLEEVERLLAILLEGWRTAESTAPGGSRTAFSHGAYDVKSNYPSLGQAALGQPEAGDEFAYGGYLPEAREYQASAAYSF